MVRTPQFWLCIALAAWVLSCGAEPVEYTVGADARGSSPAEGQGTEWPGWGGPLGNFQVAGGELALQWPSAGPPLLWSRPLGGGYSAVAAARGVLFTTHRDGDQDVVSARLVRPEGRSGCQPYPPHLGN